MSINSRKLALPWQSGIQGRLTFFSLLFALVPVALVGTFVFIQARATLREQIGANILELSTSVGADVDRFLTSRQGDIEVISQSPILTSSESTPEQKVEFLLGVQDAYGIYDSLYITDPEGNLVAATDRTIGDQSGQEWFENSRQGQLYSSDLYFLTTAQNFVVTFSAPVTSDDGQLLGVVAGHVDGQELFDVVREVQLGETGEVFLTNSVGKVVAISETEDIFADLSDLPAIQSALAGQSGLTVGPDFDTGEPVLYGYQPVGGVQDWIAVGSLPLAELNAPVNALAVRIALLAVVATVVVIFAVFFVTQRIVRPVRELTSSAQQLSAGDYNTSIQVHTEDEVGQLADSFREMIAAVRKRDTELVAANENLLRGNHELAVARKQAEDANRIKSEFLATMSHELRTPLNAIVGYTEIQLAGMTGDLTQEQRSYQERILLNSENLMTLINDLLDLAKIEAGRIEIIKKPFSPRDLLDQVVSQTQSLADLKGLNYQAVLDQRMPPTIVGDLERIRQICMNLVSNAIKFTEEGFVKIEIRPQTRDVWAILVSDNGIGIPSHAQEYIFDEFRQVDSSSRRKHGGTGLGLSIVRDLALMMGGNVRLNSRVDEGSVFTILLPLVTEQELEQEMFQMVQE